MVDPGGLARYSRWKMMRWRRWWRRVRRKGRPAQAGPAGGGQVRSQARRVREEFVLATRTAAAAGLAKSPTRLSASQVRTARRTHRRHVRVFSAQRPGSTESDPPGRSRPCGVRDTVVMGSWHSRPASAGLVACRVPPVTSTDYPDTQRCAPGGANWLALQSTASEGADVALVRPELRARPACAAALVASVSARATKVAIWAPNGHHWPVAASAHYAEQCWFPSTPGTPRVRPSRSSNAPQRRPSSYPASSSAPITCGELLDKHRTACRSMLFTFR